MGDESGYVTFVVAAIQVCATHIPVWIDRITIERIVPNAYFSHLAPTGTRMDHQDRPELLHGTIDIPVPQSYWSVLQTSSSSGGADLSKAAESLSHTASDLLGNLTGATPAVSRNPSPVPTYKERQANAEEEKKLRRPQGMGRVFVIDVSQGAVQRGVVREVCEGIRKAIYGTKRLADLKEREGESSTEEDEDEEVIGDNQRVAIVTVAESVGFWNLSVNTNQVAPLERNARAPALIFQPNLSRAGLMVVSDLEDMFVPLRDGFLADPTESRYVLQ
jgi:protein transport protein SEC24